ncbi:MAG: sensor histidine kinase [Deltaproteobacteria bacterium]|nr:sensor histidine kinase [Deltaproteobacteria bacterium]
MSSLFFPHHWSIKAKSVALVVVYVLALCGVYGAFTVYLVHREAAQAHDRFQQTARMVAAELDAYIESGQQRLAAVARLPGLAYGLRTIQETAGEGYIPPWTTLHYLFFKSPVFTGGVFLLDRAGKVLWTEPPGLPWLGQTLADYPPIAEIYQQGRNLISSGFSTDRLLNTPHVVVGVPIRNPNGEIDGILGGVIDLTAAEFIRILKGAPTAQGRFLEVVDQNGLVLTGKTPARLLQPASPFSQEAEGPLLAAASLTRAPWHVVSGQPRATALTEVWQLQCLLLWLGAGVLLIAVATGAPFINGFVRPIKKLTAYAEVMARGDLSQPVVVGERHDEIATLAQAFEHMRIELKRSHLALKQRLEEREELIRLKEEFLDNMSHELRTPLNVIIGYTDMLLDEGLSADGCNALTRIRAQSEHLFHLLSDLMTLSGVNTGKVALQISPVAVSDLLARLSPLVDQLRQGKDIEAVWDCPVLLPAVETDALRLEQVLTNLITNAFKFTPQGKVTIRARHDTAQERVVFEVADTGIGISVHELPHIFDEFRQVDGSMSRSYGGMGLGLALVRKLTSLLQGEIAIASQVGQGSVFTVTIPLRPAP